MTDFKANTLQKENQGPAWASEEEGEASSLFDDHSLGATRAKIAEFKALLRQAERTMDRQAAIARITASISTAASLEGEQDMVAEFAGLQATVVQHLREAAALITWLAAERARLTDNAADHEASVRQAQILWMAAASEEAMCAAQDSAMAFEEILRGLVSRRLSSVLGNSSLLVPEDLEDLLEENPEKAKQELEAAALQAPDLKDSAVVTDAKDKCAALAALRRLEDELIAMIDQLPATNHRERKTNLGDEDMARANIELRRAKKRKCAIIVAVLALMCLVVLPIVVNLFK